MAYATASVGFSTLAGASYLHMDCLYVREPWRGQALGARLWQTLHAFALEAGRTTMQWQTPEWNEAAARFYLSLGAVESRKRRYLYRLDGG